MTIAEFITARLESQRFRAETLTSMAEAIRRLGQPLAADYLDSTADVLLREVEAMRRIVAEYDPRLWFVAEVAEAAGEAWEHVTDDVRILARRAYLVHRGILRALASIWRDHPDFQEEWA